MDPNTSTRAEFTAGIISNPMPADASPIWTTLVTKLKDLMDKLAHHEAMKDNLQQTYMTPAISKNKIYFMWDFVGRTLGSAYNVNPTLKKLSKREKETWDDTRGRAMFASILLCDEKSGKLDQMVVMTYPSEKGKKVEVGEVVLESAKKLGETDQAYCAERCRI